MYAVRRVDLNQQDHQPAEERFSVQVTRSGKLVPGIRSERISKIEEDVMYWRKAHHIHEWFVCNVQNGQDDCRTYRVSWKDLRTLLSLCRAMIEASDFIEAMSDASAVNGQENPKRLVQREPGKAIEDDAATRKSMPIRGTGLVFGREENADRYLREMIRTRDWIVEMLADHDAGVPGDIYYRSSW